MDGQTLLPPGSVQPRGFRELVEKPSSGQPPERGLRWWTGERLQQGGHVARRLLPDPLFDDGSAVSAAERDKEDVTWRKQAQEKKRYIRLIQTCGRRGQAEKTLRILQELQSHSLAADLAVYHAVLDACRNCYDCELSIKVLQAMHEQGVQPDLEAYNIVLATCERCEQSTLALDILETLRRAGLKPSDASLKSILAVCERGQEWPTILRLLEEMRQDDFCPVTISWWRHRMAERIPSGSRQKWELARSFQRPMALPSLATASA